MEQKIKISGKKIKTSKFQKKMKTSKFQKKIKTNKNANENFAQQLNVLISYKTTLEN